MENSITYKLKQVCVQNPIFGPRNLGHYWGSMKDFVKNQDVHESYLVIDDIMAILMNPKEANAIKNRTYFVLQDFINCGYNIERNHVVLTSSYMSYIMELIIFYSDFIDYKFCNYLYENSFLGSLKSYQREELGLNLYPSIFEILYPQLGIPALSFALETELFQGGEEIIGYTYIMKNIKKNIKKVYEDYNYPPIYEPSRNGYVLGVDGQYMFQHNSVFLSEDEDLLIEKIEKIEDHKIVKDWLTSAGHEKIFEFYSLYNDYPYLKTLLKDILVDELRPFRENHLEIDYLEKVIISNYENIKDQFTNHIDILKKEVYKI